MRTNQNANFTGSMGGSGVPEMSSYQSLGTMRTNQNANFTGSMGGSGVPEMSAYQPMATFRAVTNENFTGSMGGSGVGEISNYNALPTNRIISNNLIGLPVSHVAGNGYTSTVTNPMATMRTNSTPLVGTMGMDSMGGHLSQNTVALPTLRQNMNAAMMVGFNTYNGVGAYASDSAERNMFIRDTKQNLLARNSPTPVNAYQPPNTITNGVLELKNYPSTVLSSTGFLPTTDYLNFTTKLKNIDIPPSFTDFNPGLIVDNNPYINNLQFKAKPNYNFGNIENNFNQISQDQIDNNINIYPLDPNINNNNF